MRVLLYTVVIFLYMVSQFVPNLYLSYAIGVCAVVAVAVSAKYASGLHRISGFVFLTLGIALFLANGLPWHTFFLHFQSMLGLLSLFLVLPFIHSLVRIGRYDQSLSQLLQDRVTRLQSLYKRSFLVCHFLGVFLNIATLPLLTKSLQPSLQMLSKPEADKFLGKNLLRAYALCLMWSPMEVLVSASIDITGAAYILIAPVVIIVVVLSVLLDFAISRFHYQAIPVTMDMPGEINIRHVYKKVARMLGMLALFVVLVSLVQYTLDSGFLFSVVLLLVPFSLVWAVSLGKTKSYLTVAIPQWIERSKGLANYFFMFLSAGMFVEILSLSGLLSFLEPVFLTASETPLVLYLLIGFYFLSTSLVGFHPMVSLTFMAEFLLPVLPHVAALPLAVVLIVCGLASVMYSPFNLSVSILANELRINPYRIAGWNVGYAVLCMLIGIGAACTLDLLFW
ncbi:hypothetical protein ACAF76_014290 [Brevibacillus sp. TJ4]|uniref:hypothetical protein n=1 Tax=Brevibacillus sp. TJ4 TaxID=3234853 RepID=UPI0037CED462